MSAKGKKKGSDRKPRKPSRKAGPRVIRVADHPRAASSIRRTKAWGGLLAFAFVALLSWHASVPPFQVGVRALAGGVAGFLVCWLCAVQVWRQLILAEIRAAGQLALARRREAGATKGAAS